MNQCLTFFGNVAQILYTGWAISLCTDINDTITKENGNMICFSGFFNNAVDLKQSPHDLNRKWYIISEFWASLEGWLVQLAWA